MSALIVEVRRGGRVESRHRVHAVISDGRTVEHWGEADMPVFPRSAVKPIQAIPLLESGAPLTPERLALACASHGGEPMHVAAVQSWLADLGRSEADLECGPHPPTHAESARNLARAGAEPSRLHNNCSGKHTGFLATARQYGEPIRGYVQPEHPVQKRVTAALAALYQATPQAWGVDGCGIPTFALPLSGLAAAYARFPQRAPTILQAWRDHPHLIAGSGRFDTELMTAIPGIAVKGGAEGVHAACLSGHGIALKVEDGAGRAAEVAMMALLVKIGAVPEGLLPERWLIRNAAGLVVGEITMA